MNGPVLVVGPGARFLSGISYYTAALVRSFTEHGRGGSALLLDRLCPALIYPGRERIGKHGDATLDYARAPVSRSLHWFWGPQILAALGFLVRRRPSVLLLQFWTGTAAHTYLLLALAARLRRARVVVEFHEVLDTGEAAITPVRVYVKGVMSLLLRLTNGLVVHSTADVAAVTGFYPAARRLPVAVIHHGPFDHLDVSPVPASGATRFAFFGVMRTYKGLPELATAYRTLRDRGVSVTLTLAGEPWPEIDDVLDDLRDMPGVCLRLGHLTDDELAEVLSHADVLVLPYRRSSASGPLHTATALGLPVVTTSLPSLVEAVAGYSGAVFAEPNDPVSLAAAMETARHLVGRHHEDPNSWPKVIARYEEFFSRLGGC